MIHKNKYMKLEASYVESMLIIGVSLCLTHFLEHGIDLGCPHFFGPALLLHATHHESALVYAILREKSCQSFHELGLRMRRCQCWHKVSVALITLNACPSFVSFVVLQSRICPCRK